jgi:Sec7-like guanine-nucleotide exchange factor
MKSLKCCLDYSQESIFILLYSSILLYNDLFNIKIQKKITLKQFIKMLKGCNSKNDFPEDLLISIYDNVQINNKANVDNIDNIDNIARDKNKKNSWCIIL